MTRDERMEKLKFLTLNQAKDIIASCHEILDRAGILGAERVECNDPACQSHLTHRIHELVDRTQEGKATK